MLQDCVSICTQCITNWYETKVQKYLLHHGNEDKLNGIPRGLIRSIRARLGKTVLWTDINFRLTGQTGFVSEGYELCPPITISLTCRLHGRGFVDP